MLSSSDDDNSYLGIYIERLTDGALQIHQRPYIEDVLARFKHSDAKPVATPMTHGLHLSKSQSPVTDEQRREMLGIPYRQLVGALLFLASCTRPDIAHAVSTLARFGSNPGPVHWTAAKHLLRYLAGTRHLCIVYGRPVADMHFCALHGNVDASWAEDPDDRRSTTGYNFVGWGGGISWRSMKQKSSGRI